MAAIFDMDGLLLDTEPLWGESMLHIANHYQIPVTLEQFRLTTGLRIHEVTAFWAERFPWSGRATAHQIAEDIIDDIIARAKAKGSIMPGALMVLEWMAQEGIARGLATSSPVRMLSALLAHFGLNPYLQAAISADDAGLGKPHPQVFLQCAAALDQLPHHCIALEDSVNGMVAAKAARMKVVVVPEHARYDDQRFGLADLKLTTLEHLDKTTWDRLQLL
jgi:HAD superfamily hydrolase (TIGR01509 family)